MPGRRTLAAGSDPNAVREESAHKPFAKRSRTHKLSITRMSSRAVHQQPFTSKVFVLLNTV